MSGSTTSLIGLATDILHLATTLEEELGNSKLPQPTLESNARYHYLDILDNGPAVQARSKLIETCNTLLTLARGPVDTLLVDLKTNLFTIAVLRAIYQLKVAEVVPPNGTISITDLATHLAVHSDGLRSILRFAFTKEFSAKQLANLIMSNILPSQRFFPPSSPCCGFISETQCVYRPLLLHFAESISLKNWPRPPITLADRPL